MNTLDITRSYINETAQKQGFQRDTLEKVVRLYYLLKDMSEIPLFRENLALKGGTAINLAYFSLPRLSVDIDMDFTRSGKMEELLPYRREIKDTLFYLLQSQGYTIGKLGKELHTLDQWTFNYQSIAGNNDHIKIELNYGIRKHILPIVDKDIYLNIVSDAGIKIPTLHPCELFATKINALIERAAVRDLFDVYSLSRSNLISTQEEKEMLKKSIIFYQTVGVEGTAKNEIDIAKIKDIQPSRIKSQLIPLLPSGRKYFPIEEAKESVMQYLSSLIVLSPSEQEYMEMFSLGIYKPELLFSDPAIIERISDHPMAIWKIAHAEKDNQLNQQLSSEDNEFQKAIELNDFPKLSKLYEQGYIPSPKVIKMIEGIAPAYTMIAIEKIFGLPATSAGISRIQLANNSDAEHNNSIDKNKDSQIEL